MDGLNELKKADLMDYQESKHMFPDNRPDWDSWFMGICCVAATRSLDSSTRHGAVICDRHHRHLGTGYNGFPRGCDDFAFPTERPQKYDITIHAEANCLLNSQNLLIGSNYTMYVTGLPCSRCFIKIMQYDIERVVYGNVKGVSHTAKQSELVFELADMRKIQLDRFDSFDCQKNIDIFKGILTQNSEKYNEQKKS